MLEPAMQKTQPASDVPATDSVTPDAPAAETAEKTTRTRTTLDSLIGLAKKPLDAESGYGPIQKKNDLDACVSTLKQWQADAKQKYDLYTANLQTMRVQQVKLARAAAELMVKMSEEELLASYGDSL